MTAAVLPYVSRLASQAEGSGKVSINQSWNTGGNLGAHHYSDFKSDNIEQ
jgi:hypothetical protein